MMLSKLSESTFRDSVRERDLDNFLVEEIHASTDFREWILSRISGTFTAPNYCEIRLRKSPPRANGDGRQTDVEIGWFDNGEMQACVLLESKVGSDFQQGQAEAYRREVYAYRARFGPRASGAILVAPAARIPVLAHDDAFDAEITIEEISEFLGARLNSLSQDELARRLEARIELLEALSGKRSAGSWSGGATIEEKRHFAQAYEDLAREILPGLRVRPSQNSERAVTVIYEDLYVSGLPGVKLRHEFGREQKWKYANVQFKGNVDKLEDLKSSGLLHATPYTAEKAGTSLSIRVRTPGIDAKMPFEAEKEKVVQSLHAIRDLVAWLEANGERIAAVIGNR
jgi:hypothetical protein